MGYWHGDDRNPIDSYMHFHMLLKDMEEQYQKKIDENKPKKPKTFTFAELFVINLLTAPIIGPLYIMMITGLWHMAWK